MEYSSYPKVYHFGHPRTDGILNGPVIVQEKVDGSQISFGVDKPDSGQARLFIHSHHCDISHIRGEYGLFTEAIKWIVENEAKLKPGLIYRGEVLCKPRHNILTYNRVPRNNIILFDIMRGPEAYMDYMDVVTEGQRLGLEVVPLLFYGTIAGETDISRLLSRPSLLGGIAEGLVLKNYKRFDEAGKPLMAKWVTKAFSEIKKVNLKDNSEAGWWEKLVIKYGGPARWHKAMQHLAEKGQLLGEPKDIGPLMVRVREDFKEEATQSVAIDLLERFMPDLERATTGGLPEWYKEQIRTKAIQAHSGAEHWAQTSQLVEVSDEELDGMTK